MKKTTQLLLVAATLLLTAFSSHGQITNYASVPYSTGFESGTLDANWYTTASAADGRIQIWDSNTLTWNGNTATAHTGTYWLGMDNSPGGNFVTTESWMGLDLSGVTTQRLQFWWSEWNEENHPEDGIYISDDGGTSFTKVLDLNGQSYTDLQWYQFDMSLDSINTVHGLNFTSTYVIKFQQHDNYYFAGGNDGFLIDDINVYTPCFTTSSINISQCTPYTVPSGDETYSMTGTYIDTIPNAAMCDSLITINLTINSTTSTLNELACGPYTVPSGDEIYTVSGTYMDTIPNAAGCDSLITINLTVGSSSSSSIAPTSCGDYTAPDGQIFTTSGTYNVTIPNTEGCDSLITIDLTVGTIDSVTTTEVACDSFMWTDGNTYTTSGVYTQNLTNSLGCDSIATLDLTINSSPTMTVASSDGVNLVCNIVDNHIWIDCSDNSVVATSGNTYMATSNGDYAVVGTLNGCSDTSACFSVINVGIHQHDNVDLSVYPNPANNTLFIDSDVIITQISIYSVVGKLVESNIPVSKSIALDGLTNGSYFLTLTLEDGRKISRRFIKQ